MGKNRIVYSVFLGLAIAFAYFYPGSIASVFFYIIILIPVISFIYVVYIYLKFKFKESVDNQFVTKGDKVYFNVEIVNTTRIIYPYVEILFYGIDTVSIKHFKMKKTAILPRGSESYAFELKCEYRGYYEVGLKYIKIRDFLGFFSFKYKVSKPKYITVYPRIITLEAFPITINKISDMEGVLIGKEEDQRTVSDVRKYAYGDSLKNIHWKLSAKKNEVMVKSFESTATIEATVILDLTKNPYDSVENMILEDKVIEVSVALIHYCLLRDIETHLMYHEEKIIKKTAMQYSDFESLYHTLFEAKFESKLGFDETIRLALTECVAKSSVIFVTSGLNDKVYGQITTWHKLNYEVILIYVSPREVQTTEILLALQKINVKVYEIHIEDDIKSILECW